MKKLLRLLFVVSILSVLVVTVVQAETSSVPGGGWWSGEIVQNVGTGDATVVVTAYGSGNQYATLDYLLAPNEAKIFAPADFSGMVDGFQGAAVVQADQPIKAIVNVTNRAAGVYGVTGGEAAAQYQGVDGSAVADTLYFPLVKNDRFGSTTSFYIQNAGTSPATALATFKMDDGTDYTYPTPVIQPNEMVIITPSDAGVPTSNTNRQNIGGLTVSSTTDLAGVVMEYLTGESPATLLQATRGFTQQDFDMTLYAPTVKQDRISHFTGIQVQNVSGGVIDVDITFKGSRGDCAGQTYYASYDNLADGASHTFNQVSTKVNDGAMIDNCSASATIVATGNIVATVNEVTTPAAVNLGAKYVATTYSAFPDVATTMKISVPLFKENRADNYTGLNVQNISQNSASVTVQFIGSKGAAAGNTYTHVAVPIAAGASKGFQRISETAASQWSGSVVPPTNSNYSVIVTANRAIVAISNEAAFPGSGLIIDENNYEGFNLPDTP
jgi:hypothetical protein